MQLPILNKCVRCGLGLDGPRHPTDCDYCDPLCPVWGTHGHLWRGDEEAARATYTAERQQEAKVPPA